MSQKVEVSWAKKSTTDAEKVMRHVTAANQFFCSYSSSIPHSAKNHLTCPYLRFAYHTIVKSFAWYPTHFNRWYIQLIMRRVKSGLLSYFLQKGDISRIIGGIQNSTALLFASDFCLHNPPEIMCFWNDSFDYSTFLLNNQIHSKSFELAFYGHLVPFCQGEASLTLSQFRRILQIILNYMQNLLNDFEQTIRSETTVGGVGDCFVSDYTSDCGISKSHERMLDLHYCQEGLSIISGFISELGQLM